MPAFEMDAGMLLIPADLGLWFEIPYLFSGLM
jgi:hypothetical protein